MKTLGSFVHDSNSSHRFSFLDDICYSNCFVLDVSLHANVLKKGIGSLLFSQAMSK